MILRSSTFLGVSLSDRLLSCAEIAVTSGKRVVRKLAAFPLTDDLSFDKPEALGAALSAFLRQKKFTASRAVVGIPAKWLIAQEKEIPPSPEDQGRAMLRLQAERLGVSDSGDMVFDYAGRITTDQPNKVLLVGLLRQRLDQIEKVIESAGLSVGAVTSSALALAQGAARGAGDDQGLPMLLLGRQGAEVVWRHEGMPRMLRHMSVFAVNGHGPVTLGPLGSELSRTMALTRSNGSATAREMLLWDGIGLSADQVAELAERAGVRVHPSDAMTMLGLEPSNSSVAVGDPAATAGTQTAEALAETFAPALALAAAAADRELLPLDFTRSRLTVRRTRRLGKRTTWLIVAGAVPALLAIGLYVWVQQRQSQLDGIEQTLAGMQKEVDEAKTVVDRMDYTRAYFDARPPLLECLREITLAYRDDEKIWTTSLSLREEERRTEKDKKLPPVRKGTLQGKASDNNTVYAMLDRLRKNQKFAAVQMLKTTEVGGKSKDVVFSASFNFTATE
jgi:hypothetical protein